MTEHWVGFVASGPSVVVVGADIPDDNDDPIIITYDQTWPLQKGDRAKAYHVLYQQCTNHLQGCGCVSATVKASAPPTRAMSKAHLEGAEARGVVIAAAASLCPVRTLPKALISRTYGDRKVDEYLKDDTFWAAHTTGGALRAGSREAAMLLIAARSTR